MKVYNTLTRQREELVPLNGDKINMYVCGPTVYNLIHIGNARPLCVFDAIRRFLIFSGYDVTYISNFTDVDDKIIKRSNEENINSKTLSEKYIAEFFTDSDGLGVKRADYYPKVTENMDAVIDMVDTLIKKGYAYEADGDVYFSAQIFEGYGKLSHMPIDDLVLGARIEVNEKKREPLDFALWKAAKPGEPSWDSPWGKGRPGWHIECSAMSRKIAGDTLDIHGGGQDLCFPHHENEIAQSEAATGKPLANVWLHNGFININNAKMSKSAGNFFTVRDIAEKYGYEPIRLFQIQSHYRSPVNFDEDTMKSAKTSLERLYNCRENLMRAAESANSGQSDPGDLKKFQTRRDEFIAAMSDDFNTADALSVIFELTKDLNILIKENEAPKETFTAGLQTFDELCGVLGILYNKKTDEIPEDVKKLSDERTNAKKAKNFALADEIREKILSMGYNIEDTRQGVKISKI
ncbi:MAG: cysteine--tRNA ligase [Ruminococcus sp.]|nr:cysteine--tRNA ligase [Ruminococcus sp.]